MERTTARERFAEEAVMFPVDVSRVSEESGREALEALRRMVVGRRRVWVEEDRGWAAESECNRARAAVRDCKRNFQEVASGGLPAGGGEGDEVEWKPNN